MVTDNSVMGQLGIYICPACKHPLQRQGDMLWCPACSQAYPITERIPDFIQEELARCADPVFRRMRFIDRMAGIYESKLWYPIVLKVYGGFRSLSFPELIVKMTEKVQPVSGRVLDVACGPGTYGRRIASSSKEVFGIDISMGMLRQGVAYVARDRIPNMHFTRARVEALPFEDGFFDAVLCGGSMHLFGDTLIALREMARVMKAGAILSVFTFGAGARGILKFRRVRQRSFRHHGLHVFELAEIEEYLAAAGFEDFLPEMSGSILTFGARKRAA